MKKFSIIILGVILFIMGAKSSQGETKKPTCTGPDCFVQQAR